MFKNVYFTQTIFIEKAQRRVYNISMDKKKERSTWISNIDLSKELLQLFLKVDLSIFSLNTSDLKELNVL